MTPHIEIADSYFHDCEDFLYRYRLTFNYFTSMKSKRFKLFVDLRMAFECALKACAIYFQMKDLSRKDIIDRLHNLGHDTSKLIGLVSESLTQTQLENLRSVSEEVRMLHVGLRYDLDQVDFRVAQNDLYYQTVGSDVWLNRLHDVTTELSALISESLQTHSRVVSVKDLMKDVLTPKYNKTLKRNL
jgi:hypothetical protein